MNDPLRALGLRTAVIIAGFAGGLVALQETEGLTRGKAAAALFTSLAIAGYGTPLVLAVIGGQPDAIRYGIAFLLGLCAMKLVPLVQAAVPSYFKKIVEVKTGGPSGKGDPE